MTLITPHSTPCLDSCLNVHKKCLKRQKIKSTITRSQRCLIYFFSKISLKCALWSVVSNVDLMQRCINENKKAAKKLKRRSKCGDNQFPASAIYLLLFFIFYRVLLLSLVSHFSTFNSHVKRLAPFWEGNEWDCVRKWHSIWHRWVHTSFHLATTSLMPFFAFFLYSLSHSICSHPIHHSHTEIKVNLNFIKCCSMMAESGRVNEAGEIREKNLLVQ